MRCQWLPGGRDIAALVAKGALKRTPTRLQAQFGPHAAGAVWPTRRSV